MLDGRTRAAAEGAADGDDALSDAGPDGTIAGVDPVWTSPISPENTASLALHEREGFRVVGVYNRHGKLEGVWRHCVIVEKLLDEADS